MKIKIQTGYRADLMELAEGVNDLMADLEDVREDALELLEKENSEEVRRDISRMDAALKALSEAADQLEDERA
ncbi:MAG: hypothetical protein IKQ41_10830 [Clostridia bacterium]|nr:hypothetical protein [Clostridia bacterium]